MPDNNYSEVLQEAFATARNDIVVLDTIEIFHPDLNRATKDLQLCFAVDNTGSQSGAIESIKQLATDVSNLLSDEFESIVFSLIQFRDEDQTSIVTGAEFVDLETFQGAIDTLEARGGGDSRENGLGAVVLSGDLPWSEDGEVSKCIFLISDVESHERGATQQEAIESLLEHSQVFCYQNSSIESIISYTFVGAGLGTHTYNEESGDYDYVGDGLGDFESSDFIEQPSDVDHEQYQPLADATGGIRISSGTAEEVAAEFATLLRTIVSIEAQEPLYFVRDVVPHELTLEGDGGTKTFEPVGFQIELPSKGDDGAQDLSIAIDNTDRRASNFVQAALAIQNQPIQIKYRPYLLSDKSQPQMDPPLVLYLSEVNIGRFEVTGRASFADVVNKAFLSENYTHTRFPGL